MTRPRGFKVDPAFTWGFYARRLHLYRCAQPHEGYMILREIAALMTEGFFVLTLAYQRWRVAAAGRRLGVMEFGSGSIVRGLRREGVESIRQFGGRQIRIYSEEATVEDPRDVALQSRALKVLVELRRRLLGL
jgi:hypothetical protein